MDSQFLSLQVRKSHAIQIKAIFCFSVINLPGIKLKSIKEPLFQARTVNMRMEKMFSELLFDVILL